MGTALLLAERLLEISLKKSAHKTLNIVTISVDDLAAVDEPCLIVW